MSVQNTVKDSLSMNGIGGTRPGNNSKQSSSAMLFHAIYGNKRFVPNVSKPLISGNASGTGFVVSDVNSIFRASDDLVSVTLSGTQSPMGQTVLNSLGGLDTTIVYQLSGVASAVNTIGWASQIPRNFDQVAHADKIGDGRGKVMAQLSIGRNATGVAAGLSLGLGFRIGAIVSALRGVSPSGFTAPTLLGRVTYGFLFVGLVLFAVFNTLLSIACGISLYEGEKLRSRIKNADDPIALLQKKLVVDQDKMLEKLEKKYGDKLNDMLAKEALTAGKEALKLLMKELDIPEATDAKLEAAVKAMINDHCGGKLGEKELHQALVETGKVLRATLLALKKEEKLTRVLGSTLVEQLKTGKIDHEEMFLDKVTKALDENRFDNIFALVTLTISTISLIAAIVFTGGVGLIVGIVIMLVANIVMLALDYHFFKKSLESEQGATHDKKMIAVSIATCLVTIAVIITLSALGVVSFGTVPLAIMIGISLMWIGYNVYTWQAIDQKAAEKKAKEEEELKLHPTLDSFLDVAKEGDHEKIAQCFRRLPEELRLALTAEMKDGIDAEEAAQQLKDKIEQANKKALDDMRGIVSKYLIA